MRFKYNAYYTDTHCTDSNRKNDDMRKLPYIFRDHSTLINRVHTKYSRIGLKDVSVRKNFSKQKAYNVFENVQLVMSKGQMPNNYFHMF